MSVTGTPVSLALDHVSLSRPKQITTGRHLRQNDSIAQPRPTRLLVDFDGSFQNPSHVVIPPGAY
ncbi:hypothetical protein LPJ74_006622, partial [Coemansia sp. RSA 1843]